MEQNLIIYGINETEDPKVKENSKESTLNFLSDQMKLTFQIQDIWKAHRLGYRKEGYVRPMIIKVAYHVKETIMENLGMLKGKVNEKNQKPLFISEQIPQAVNEAKKQISARLASINKANEALPPAQRKKIQVQNEKILLDGQLMEPEITTPQPSELFLDGELQAKVDALNRELIMTNTIKIKHSEFVGLALKTNKIEQVKLAYKAAMQRFPSADHMMMAYALKENGQTKFGHCDDNEYGGGMIIRKTMAQEKSRDTAIFVMRRYGGIHLGYERFTTIESIVKEALHLLSQSA